jgi:simple sugar transport system substrate-binding protein/basic membrane protein A
MYIDIVKVSVAGDFTGSEYNANFRVGYKDGANPFVQSKYGPSVDQATQDLIVAAKETISTTGSPFEGPIYAQDGSLLVPEGTVPDYAEIEELNVVFVKGVVGDIPKS